MHTNVTCMTACFELQDTGAFNVLHISQYFIGDPLLLVNCAFQH